MLLIYTTSTKESIEIFFSKSLIQTDTFPMQFVNVKRFPWEIKCFQNFQIIHCVEIKPSLRDWQRLLKIGNLSQISYKNPKANPNGQKLLFSQIHVTSFSSTLYWSEQWIVTSNMFKRIDNIHSIFRGPCFQKLYCTTFSPFPAVQAKKNYSATSRHISPFW